MIKRITASLLLLASISLRGQALDESNPNLYGYDAWIASIAEYLNDANLTVESPGASKYWGTNGAGAKNWYDLPSGGGATNLTNTPSPTGILVGSSTGTDTTLPLATGTNAGLLAPADFTAIQNAVEIADIDTIAELDAIVADAEIVTTTGTQSLTNKTMSGVDYDIGTGNLKIVSDADGVLETVNAPEYDTTWSVNPNDVYDQSSHHAVVIGYTTAPITVSRILIDLDVDPATELTATVQFNAISTRGFGSATTIEAITTAAGVNDFTSGFDDPTVPANQRIFIVFSDADDAILLCSGRLEASYD